MDPIKILKRAWYILWSYRALWVFGLVLALAAGSSTGRGSNNGTRYEQSGNENHQFTPQSMQQAFRDFQHEVDKLFKQGIPRYGYLRRGTDYLPLGHWRFRPGHADCGDCRGNCTICF